MRVVAGSARGRKLEAPKGLDTRPTGDMVKEAIFNIIQVKVPEAEALDLFSGTGQLGIEALSRGAARCVFVDESNEMHALTKKNVTTTGLMGGASVIRSGAIEYLRRAGKFDIIFLDPPYEGNLMEQALDAIIEFDILREHGIIVCESRESRIMPDLPYDKSKDYRYGKTKITIYTRQPRGQ